MRGILRSASRNSLHSALRLWVQNMGFRSSILFLLIVFNTLPLYAVYRGTKVWVHPESRRKKALLFIGLTILLINFPITAFWFRSLQQHLFEIPASVLRAIFSPAVAWQSTALLFTVFLGPVYVIWAAARAVRRIAKGEVFNSQGPDASRPPEPVSGAPLVSRRSFVAGGAGLLVPAAFGASAIKLFADLDEVDIPPILDIPVPHLPRSLDGMTILQLSDLHVGPYIRRKEVEYWVHLANQMNPDLVVLTGDMIDRSLDSLPDTLEGLRGIESTLGVVGVLGNHDLSSDRHSSRGNLLGGETIAQGLESIGIRILRNEVTHIGSGPDRLAVLGLDWIRSSRSASSNPGGPGDFYRYHSPETRQELDRMVAGIGPETPSLLLAHHPDTFIDLRPGEIGLTLAGHTHGGGQVVFFRWNGEPVGISTARFKYVSGLFQEKGCNLYVNRGLGYFGVPVRINCPPEISRFRLRQPE